MDTERSSTGHIGGRVTLPAESGREKETASLVRKWGADAIRDSDGTELSRGLTEMGSQVYSTICLVRADQQWNQKYLQYLPEKYLMSEPVTANSSQVDVDLLQGYHKQKYRIDTDHDPKTYWEVIDRTTGTTVEPSQWRFCPGTGLVCLSGAIPFHVYTVSFLVYLIWDPTSMYNHLVNKWTGPHVISTDPYHPEAYGHLMKFFDQWLVGHPQTDVVRLTSLAYHFTLDSDATGRDKYRDWLGYTDCISPAALDDFTRDKGYSLRPEDLVDQGYYNATYRVPTREYLDWMDFVQRFVARYCKDLVAKVHRAGKKAAVFWGDHWIGLEPYGPRYQEMGLDISIGACEDGVALRRIADSPGPDTKEIRLYPYFFPDVFTSGGKPLEESRRNWLKIRRALVRRCVDRIGYGGYLSLAAKFPEFVDHVADLCEEFRTIVDRTAKTPPFTAPVRVAVLTAWGKLRSWINHTGPDEKFHSGRADIVEIMGSNLLECLSGLAVQVRFIRFADIAEHGVPGDIDVIINDGAAGTAWSGGEWWCRPEIAAAIRQWVHEGGGFIGCIDPSACEYQGRVYQLSDIMGVQKEVGHSINSSAAEPIVPQSHYILQDQLDLDDLGIADSYVYAVSDSTNVLRIGPSGHILAATNTFGQGRSVYLAALPYSLANCRLLERAIFWISHKERYLHHWFSSNYQTSCAAFPKTGWYVVLNHTDQAQTTSVSDPSDRHITVTLAPWESRWFRTDSFSAPGE